MVATYTKYILDFKRPSGTSRGILTQKETWFIILKQGEKVGIGECGLLRGLSCDDVPQYEETLQWACQNIDLGLVHLWQELLEFPSIQFGLEQAFLSLEAEGPFEIFPSTFSKGNDTIPINGLIWMGDTEFMLSQVAEKLAQGFRCIKMKIGAIDFASELHILETIRSSYPQETIELRVDANGAFSPTEALDRLKTLAQFDLHSIEQPIQQGQWSQMARLCTK
ncbi:MAG: enolase C-terminal domain-like protein, partial [Flavobacteriaceae bacterium]